MAWRLNAPAEDELSGLRPSRVVCLVLWRFGNVDAVHDSRKIRYDRRKTSPIVRFDSRACRAPIAISLARLMVPAWSSACSARRGLCSPDSRTAFAGGFGQECSRPVLDAGSKPANRHSPGWRASRRFRFSRPATVQTPVCRARTAVIGLPGGRSPCPWRSFPKCRRYRQFAWPSTAPLCSVHEVGPVPPVCGLPRERDSTFRNGAIFSRLGPVARAWPRAQRSSSMLRKSPISNCQVVHGSVAQQ